jgi:hypothetical protein
MLNFTHDPAAQSWVAAAQSPGCDFTLQNLPFGIIVAMIAINNPAAQLPSVTKYWTLHIWRQAVCWLNLQGRHVASRRNRRSTPSWRWVRRVGNR